MLENIHRVIIASVKVFDNQGLKCVHQFHESNENTVKMYQLNAHSIDFITFILFISC